MKKILFLGLLIVSQYSYSNCSVYIPAKEFNVAGLTIHFDFTKLLYGKNYEEVYRADLAHFQLLVEGTEENGTFNKAHSSLKLVDIKGSLVASAESKVTCFTQFCGVSDYAKSFNKSYKQMTKKIPACQ